MRHRKFTFKIGRDSSHRRALVANAVCSLITEGRITTTVTKAKQIRRVAEKMVTLGKSGTLHDRRRAISALRHPNVVAHLFSEIAPKYQERNGGYTRLMRLGQRRGDAADMAILEFIPDGVAAETPDAGAAADTEKGVEGSGANA